jgi:hypothetical protein
MKLKNSILFDNSILEHKFPRRKFSATGENNIQPFDDYNHSQYFVDFLYFEKVLNALNVLNKE